MCSVAASGPRLNAVILMRDVLGVGLGELDEHVPVAVLVEDAGVEQLVLELGLRAAPVLRHQLSVGVLRLRVLVEHLHVRVGRRAVEIEVVLLDVLAVIPLAVGEAEHPLLEDRILAVPERERQAEEHLVVAESGDAVLAAQVGARAGLIVRDVVPGLDVLVQVLSNAAPLPLTEVGPPLPPGDLLAADLFEAGMFAGGLGLLAHRFDLLVGCSASVWSRERATVVVINLKARLAACAVARHRFDTFATSACSRR